MVFPRLSTTSLSKLILGNETVNCGLLIRKKCIITGAILVKSPLFNCCYGYGTAYVISLNLLALLQANYYTPNLDGIEILDNVLSLEVYLILLIAEDKLKVKVCLYYY